MKQLRRRLRPSNDKRRSAFLAAHDRPVRRALLTERLESRHMMAGDFMSPYWNALTRSDVNQDGMVAPLDALVVINELNTNGSYNLLERQAASGAEGEGSQPQFMYDVNNDGNITPIDALIVINDLNAEGEGANDVVRYYIYPVLVGTDTPIATIEEGQDFELVMKVDDARPGGPGVFAAYIDIKLDTSLVDVYVNEIQYININGFPSGGSFTLTFNGQTTAAIDYNDQATDTHTKIRDALVALPNIGPDDIEVFSASSGGQVRYGVKFKGVWGDVDVPEMTGNGSGLTGGVGTMSVTVTEAVKGVDTDPDAFRNAFLTDFALPNGFRYNNSPSANLLPDRFDDVGAVGQIFLPGTTAAIEFARVRMNVKEAGRVDFIDDIESVISAHETLVYASTQDTSKLRVDPEEIGVYRNHPTSPLDGTPAFIIVTEKLAAATDNVTTTEGQAVTIPVLANDTTTPPGGTITIQSVNTSGAQGTAQIQGNSIVFTPAPDFYGTTSFTYVARTVINSVEYTDVGTVNVTVNPVNDAPIIILPTAPAVVEDTPVVINGISVVDVDAGTANLSVTLTSTLGTLTLGSTTGLDSLTGNGTGNITFQGSLSEINAALNGLIYTPNAETNGNASITLTVNDLGNGPAGQGLPALSDTKSLNFAIAAVNDKPVLNIATPTFEVLEEETLDVTGITVTDVDADISGGVQITLSVDNGILTLAGGTGVDVQGSGTSTVVVTGPVAGAVNVNTILAGLQYTPDEDFFDFETLSIEVSDLGHTGPIVETASGEIEIDVQAAVRPRARIDRVDVPEDSTAVDIDVLDNDFVTNDDNADPLDDATPILLGVFDSNNDLVDSGTVVFDEGTVEIVGSQLRFTPAADFDGVFEFSYQMTDSENELNTDAYSTGTVRITIVNLNADAPVAVNDEFSTTEDAVLATGNLIANDTDPDTGDTLSAVAETVTSALGATITINADGSFSYDPSTSTDLQALATGEQELDTFVYTVRDVLGATSVGTVEVTVTGVNDAAVGVASQHTVDEDELLTVDAPGVLAGVTDVDTPVGSLTAVLDNDVANGTLILNADGSFTYEPNDNFFGTDSFTFRVDDGETLSAPVTVTINVTGVNDAPVASADPSYSTNEDIPLVISTRAAGVLGNDTDLETQNTLTAVLKTQPASGNLQLNSNGTFTYTPAANFNGVVTFTYAAFDGELESNEVTVTITVDAVNDAPVGVADSYTGASEDSVFTVDPIDSVLDNDTDADIDNGEADAIEAVATTVTSAKGATVTINTDGSFSYDPTSSAQLQALAEGATTTDTFTYTVRDLAGAASTATVTITITGANDAPVANDDSFGAIANVPKTVNVLTNDTDVDTGDTRTIQSVSDPVVAGATVTFNANGEITYTAPAGYEGADSFTYTIVDSNGETSTATVNVTVQNFLPTDISGYVYIDKTTTAQPGGNGQRETGERGVANVTVVLSSPTGVDMFGNPFTPIPATTDANGYYVFNDVVPGNYVITQVQPEHLRDGLETATETEYARLVAGQNNKIYVDLPQLGAADGNVENNNFAELGIDATTLDNSAGLLQEMLASSSQNGLVASTNRAGQDFWFWALNNWSGLTSVDIQLSSNLASLTLTATINGATKTTTINQQPNSLGGRFRILGYTDEGGYLIRIDGKASDFQWAAVQQPAGEGEGGDADAQYLNSVDQVLAEQSWA